MKSKLQLQSGLGLGERHGSSKKPELHNILKRRQTRTEARQQATCTKNLVKFERVVSEICARRGKGLYLDSTAYFFQCFFSVRLMNMNELLDEYSSSI